MRRLDPPEQLARQFAGNAAAWQQILGVDASPLTLFSRLSTLGVAFAALQRVALDRFGINFAELTVLAILRTAENHRASPTELRAMIAQSSAGTTRILDKLEAEGHLHREDIEGDRRRVDIALSATGAALAEQAVAALLAAESAVLAPLGAEDRAAIARGLDVLLGAFAALGK